MRFPGMRNDLGTQVGARRKIPAEASIACLTKSASVLLGGAGGFLAGGTGLDFLAFFLAGKDFLAMPMDLLQR